MNQAWFQYKILPPFIAKPIFQRIAHLDDATYLYLMQQRKAEVKAFIRKALIQEA